MTFNKLFNQLAPRTQRNVITLTFVAICIGIAVFLGYLTFQPIKAEIDNLDAASNSVVLSKINNHLDTSHKVANFNDLSVIFVDIDTTTLKRIAQQEDYDGARVLATVYTHAFDHGQFLTDEYVRTYGGLSIYTHRTLYLNLKEMATRIKAVQETQVN